MSKKYKYSGKLYTLKELEGISGIVSTTIEGRMKRGMSVSKAIGTSVNINFISSVKPITRNESRSMKRVFCWDSVNVLL